MAKAKKAHYVDNKQLYAVMVEYKKAVDEAEQTGDIKPQVPNYVGRCLLQIANRLATKPNFANYTFKDDMISDGIENCVSYIHNFDPEKSNNPFAYFTQIIYYAFLRRIQKEKKQLYIKHKSLEQSVLFNSLVEGDDKGIGNNVEIGSDYMNDFVKNFEAKEVKTKEKRKQAKGVEKYF
jgi:DNA-directed RNA polymerase specialized sigma24 family protein|tara:strand:- start:2903 stop:3439 length:537 start_codon:yes stop_codon:yes gene_type:complete